MWQQMKLQGLRRATPSLEPAASKDEGPGSFWPPSAPSPAPRPPAASPRYLVPLLLQLHHLALQGAHLLLVDLTVHLSLLELQQGLLLLFPVLDGGAQARSTMASALRVGLRMGGGEPGGWGKTWFQGKLGGRMS